MIVNIYSRVYKLNVSMKPTRSVSFISSASIISKDLPLVSGTRTIA